VSVEADVVWRIVAAMSVAAIYRALPRGAQPSRQRQSDLVSFADRGEKTWEQCGGIQKFWLCKSKEESNELEGSSLVTVFLNEKSVTPPPGSILKSINKVRGAS